MGYTAYSASTTRSYLSDCAAKGIDAFDHTAAIASGAVDAKVHELLDPSKPNKAGKLVREAFDSDAHPDTLAIGVAFDVTGSMRSRPREFVQKLPELMEALVKKGFVQHPQILFGAIGDATCDDVPIQVGQFESGNEMDSALTKMHLEGGGGGHITESYELMMYYLARHTEMDCLNKRGKKGYLFLIGDEIPYAKVSKAAVKKHIGDELEADVPTTKVLDELRQKFEVFWLMPGGTNHWGDPGVEEPLRDMFGQNFSKLENPSEVCERIATTIGLAEGYDPDDVAAGLKDIGFDAATINRHIKAVVPFIGGAVTKTGTASEELVPAGTDGAARL